jgi:hypothetical protein
MPSLTRQIPDGGIRAGRNDTTLIAAKRLVKYDTGNGIAVALATAATDKLVGVTMESIDTDRCGDVQVAGKAILTAGSGGVARTNRITSDGSGKGIVTTTQGNTIAGVALTDADADEDFEIDLEIGAHVP